VNTLSDVTTPVHSDLTVQINHAIKERNQKVDLQNKQQPVKKFKIKTKPNTNGKLVLV